MTCSGAGASAVQRGRGIRVVARIGLRHSSRRRLVRSMSYDESRIGSRHSGRHDGVMKKSLGLTLAAAVMLSFGTVAPAAAVQAKPAPDYPSICLVWKVAQLCSNVKPPKG